MKRIEKGEFVVVPTTLQQAIAAATGGFAPAQVDASFLSPISSAIIEEALKNPEPGVWVSGCLVKVFISANTSQRIVMV